MGAKPSSYASVFTLRQDQPPTHRGAVHGAYIDYSQFPVSGVIGVSAMSVENFNGLDSTRVACNNSVIEITACDFDLTQRILAIGLRDGGVKLMDVEKLNVKDVFLYDNKLQEKYPAVTAVNCRLKDRIIVGYENGVVKEFSLLNPAPIGVFIPPLKDTESDTHPSVSFIECVEKEDLILVAYNKGKDSARIYSYKSGSTSVVATMNYTTGSILALQTLEWARAVIVLSKSNNELAIYNYLDGEQLIALQVNIPGLTEHNPLSAFALLPVTRQMRQVYIGDTEMAALDQPDDSLQGPKGDIIVLGLENGTILVAYLTIKAESGKILGSVVPQQIYKSQSKDQPTAPGIRTLHIDPVTDRLLAGDGEGNIITFEKVITRVLNPVKAKQYEEERKAKSGSWINRLGLGGWNVLEETQGNIPHAGESPVDKKEEQKKGMELEMVEKAQEEEKK